MNIRASLLLLVATAFSWGAAQAAPADGRGWYAGAAGGRVDADYSVGGNQDQGGSTFALHGGYALNRYFAIEAGYADQGGKRYVYDCPAGYFCELEAWPQVYQQSFRRAEVSLVGTLPLGERFELFAKAGHSLTRFDQSFVAGLYPADIRSDDLSDQLYGLGGRWHITPRWSLRLEWDRTELRYFTLHSQWMGVEYRFGR